MHSVVTAWADRALTRGWPASIEAVCPATPIPCSTDPNEYTANARPRPVGLGDGELPSLGGTEIRREEELQDVREEPGVVSVGARQGVAGDQ